MKQETRLFIRNAAGKVLVAVIGGWLVFFALMYLTAIEDTMPPNYEVIGDADDHYVVYSTRDGVYALDVGNVTPVALRAYPDAGFTITIALARRLNVIAIQRCAIELVDSIDGNVLGTLSGDACFQYMAWNARNDRIAASTATGRIEVWDPARFERLSSIETDEAIHALEWIGDTNQIMVASSSTGIRILNIEEGTLSRPVSSSSNVYSMSWNDTLGWLASGSGTELLLWDIVTRQSVFSLPLEARPFWITDVAWSPDRTRIAVALHDRIVVFTVESAETVRPVVTMNSPGNAGMILSIDWLSDNTVAGVFAGSRLAIWDVTTGGEVFAMLLD